MRFKQLLTKTLLVAAGLCVGANSAWAETTIGAIGTGWSAASTSAYTLSTGKTLTFTFTVDETNGNWWDGYVAVLAKTAKNDWGGNQYVFLRAHCDYIIGSNTKTAGQAEDMWGTGALYNYDTYGEVNKENFYTGATVNMAIKRVGKNVLITTAITKDATTYYHYYQQNLGTTDDVYAFLAADNAQLTITGDAITDNGLTEEAYDFYANRPASNVDCTTTGYIDVNKTSSNIIANTQIEMNDRFAAQFGSGRWLMHKDYALYSANNAGRRFAVLNLKANDRVVVTFPDGYAPTFTGTPNAYIATSGDVSDGTALVSGMCYTIKADGMFALQAPNYGRINSVTIYTSAPVLSKPTATFSGMVESKGLYYPKFTFSSADDGVTFYDGDGNNISSGYTFTAAGTLTFYASKAGRTNSAKQTYEVAANQVGMILANSVNVSSLTGTVNYATGYTLAYGDDISFGTWAVPGLACSSDNWVYYTSYIGSAKGTRTLTCSVLNENRIATYKHSTGNNASIRGYDLLTSSNNSVSFARYEGLNEYNLYVMPSEEVSVTIGSTGYSTFSSPVPLNFAGIDGLTAYVATTVADGAVTLSPVTSAPANTGLVLKGTADETYSIPVTNSAATPASNLLVGCIVETTVAADATSGYNNYVLAIEDEEAKFQSLITNGATIPAGKAFLKNGAYVSSGAKSLSIIFDNETLGINDAMLLNGNAEGMGEKAIYNLSGQRIAAPQKGINIIGGRKVVVK